MGSSARRGRAAAGTPPPLLLMVATVTLFWGGAAAAAFGGAGSTDLQKHVAFFDGNGDGIVTLSETYDAFRSLGFGAAASSASAAFINGGLGSKTRPENATSPQTDIYIEYINKGIHGSDTGSYNAGGSFVPAKFEEIFVKYTKTTPDALTSDEIQDMLHANRAPGDYKGWVAAESEWKILYTLAKGSDGLLHKDAVRSVYDGSLFYQMAKGRGTPSGN